MVFGVFEGRIHMSLFLLACLVSVNLVVGLTAKAKPNEDLLGS